MDLELSMSTTKNLIEVKTVGCSGTIILNRPSHRNALTRSMIELLGEALDDLYRQKSVRAIILTGAGDSFCSGLDLQEMLDPQMLNSEESSTPYPQWGEDAAKFRNLLLQMLEITKPLIAAVHGAALSGGAGLVAACDIVVASEDSSFGLPDPQYGLVAGVVAPLICHRIGTGQATRLLLTSATIDATEAQRLGLFHELVDGDLVWARAVEIAKQCATGAPEAIQLTKRLLHETVGEQLETQLAAGAVMRATSCTTEAAQEGIAAHLAQRLPEWK